MDGLALVARNLRRLRVGVGISQEQLAADAKVDRAYLGGLERGAENPTVKLLDKLAGALQVRLAEFFEEPAPGEPPQAPLRGGRKPK